MLDEARLATDLGLSRIPAREATSRLEMDGFIRITPKKGIYVSDIQLSDVLQIFQTRHEIKPVALRMAAPHLPMEKLYKFRKKLQGDLTDIQNGYRLDTAVHLLITEYCGDRCIIDMMHKLFDDSTRVIIANKQNQVQTHDARHERLETIETLTDREYEKAAIMTQTRTESYRRTVVDYSCFPQAFSPTPPPTHEQRLQELEIQIISQDMKLQKKRPDDMCDKDLTIRLR